MFKLLSRTKTKKALGFKQHIQVELDNTMLRSLFEVVSGGGWVGGGLNGTEKLRSLKFCVFQNKQERMEKQGFSGRGKGTFI